MAFSPSNPGKIMETPTKFDLSDSLAQWRAACAQSATLRPEDRAELEAHLRDSMAALRRQGLSEEEAFLIGTKRLGAPSKLAAEFGKVNVSEVWFSRIAWMFAGTLMMSAIQTSFHVVTTGSAVLWTKLGNQPPSFTRLNGWETSWLGLAIGLLLVMLPLAGWFWAARRLITHHSTFEFKPTKPLRLFLAFGGMSAAVSLAGLWIMNGLVAWGNIGGVFWTNAIWSLSLRNTIHAFAIPLCFFGVWRCVAKREAALLRG